jgi:hypothetical protein
MMEKDWRDGVMESIKEESYIAVENLGILTEKDTRTAMGAIKQSEATRDEAEEWKDIRELQRQTGARLFGDGPNWEQATDLFSNTRGFTYDEMLLYKESLSSLFKKTGRRIF